MADGGNVALHEIDGLVVILKLQGACGSCPSSTMTLKMGIETRLRDKIPEILEVEQILDTETGLELTEENVESVCNWNLSIISCIAIISFVYHFLRKKT
jgi:Fe-S cluster biogenesis protein NfuA